MDSGKSLLNLRCLAHIDYVDQREHCCQEKDSQNFRGIDNLSFSYSPLVLQSMHLMSPSLPRVKFIKLTIKKEDLWHVR